MKGAGIRGQAETKRRMEEGMRITITMKDGTTKEWQDRGRPGGSYSCRLRYEHGFVVVTDEWDKETAIPAADIKEIKSEPRRGWT